MSSWGLDQRGHLRTSPAPAQLKSPNIFWPADRAWCVAAVGAGATLQLSAAAILALGLASASAMALWTSRS